MKLKKWTKENKLMKDSTIFARILDHPMITPPENCRYDACIVIEEDLKIENSSLKADYIHGGKYAVLEIEHSEVAVQKAWSYVFNAIADKRINYNQSKPILERYEQDLVKNNKCEICVPIQ
jgi:DNA gyrase inhibitor GyrI